MNAFDGSQGAYSPAFHREFANSAALTTSSAVLPTSLSIYFSKPKKLDQGKEPENGMLNRHKKRLLELLRSSPDSRQRKRSDCRWSKTPRYFSRQAISSAANAGIQRRCPNSPQGLCCPPGTPLLNGRPADNPVLGDTNTIIFYGRQP